MLRAIRRHIFSKEYSVYATEQILTSINWTQDGFQLGSSSYDIYWFTENGGIVGRVRYAVEHEGRVLATSEEPQHPKFRVVVEEPGFEYILKTPTFFTISKFDLLKAGEKIGSIYADNWYQAKITIDLPSEISLPLQMFIFWLVLHIANSVSSTRMMRMHTSRGK